MDLPVETQRATLKLLTLEDFSDMIEMLLDPDTTLYINHLHRKSKEEYEAVLHDRIAQIKSNIGFHWVGRLNTTNELVGAVNLSRIPNTQIVQLGFHLKKKFWNKGFATELAQKILEVETKGRGLTTIYGVFEKGNVASKKVLEKLGFEADSKKILDEENVRTYRYIVRSDSLKKA